MLCVASSSCVGVVGEDALQDGVGNAGVSLGVVVEGVGFRFRVYPWWWASLVATPLVAAHTPTAPDVWWRVKKDCRQDAHQ